MSKSVPLGRRVTAVVALLAPLAVLAVVVVVLLRRPLVLALAVGCVGLGVGAAAYAVTRAGIRRTLAAVLAVLALAGAVVLIFAAAGGLLVIGMVVALILLGAVATRHALGRDIKSLKSSPTPGTAVGPAARPVLLMNPKSGGGKVERFNLVEEARRRGIEPVVLAPGDDLLRLAERAVADGADVVGMAGGDGSQALVASVAAAHDVGFVCIPAGTRNHLAMDLGLDREDVVGALDAFGEAVERRIDLGLVGDRVFVNNATVGLYAKIVQSPAYREHKVGTALELLPAMLGPDAAPFDLRFTGPDGTEHASAHLILVSNDRYQLGSGEGFGSRRSIDGGNLGIVAATFRSRPRSPGCSSREPRAGTGARRAGWSGPTPASSWSPAGRWRSASTARRWCSTRRSGSAPSPAPCASASPWAPPATPPPPPPPPRAGPGSPPCSEPSPAARWPSAPRGDPHRGGPS